MYQPIKLIHLLPEPEVIMIDKNQLHLSQNLPI